jgi:hypothetical protein
VRANIEEVENSYLGTYPTQSRSIPNDVDDGYSAQIDTNDDITGGGRLYFNHVWRILSIREFIRKLVLRISFTAMKFALLGHCLFYLR